MVKETNEKKQPIKNSKPKNGQIQYPRSLPAITFGRQESHLITVRQATSSRISYLHLQCKIAIPRLRKAARPCFRTRAKTKPHYHSYTLGRPCAIRHAGIG
jgi:hypothetical protein